MRLVRAHFALLALTLLSGCGYIHFGRLEKLPAGGGDAALATAYANLATEHKMLKQELVLARKEGDAFRVALERGSTGTATENVARLNEATKELAALRASYARLQSERAKAGSAGIDASRFSELEDKLAASLRTTTQLQDENARLRRELDRTRGDNAVLAERLKDSAAQNEQANHALEMLNVELLAQKQARARAEQASEAFRAQLGVVIARGSADAAGSPAEARDPAPATTAALQLARAPSADATPTAELRLNTERLRQTAGTAPGPEAASAPRPRVHVVQAGDTLEKISLRYYNSPDQWRAIYEANIATLSDGQPIRVGMELQLP